jgi:hypothetical protein
MTPLILRKRPPNVRASKVNSRSFPTLRRQCRIADSKIEQLGRRRSAAAAAFCRAGKNSRRSAPRLHAAPQISRREGPHGSAAPRLLRRTRPRPRQRAILDRGLSADRRNAEVARIEQSEIRVCREAGPGFRFSQSGLHGLTPASPCRASSSRPRQLSPAPSRRRTFSAPSL